MDSDLIATRRAAEILRCSVRAVHRLVAAGQLAPARKLDGLRGALLFARADVEALAAERNPEAVA